MRASAWECELYILLADCNIKHIHFRWGKRAPGRAENGVNATVGTQLSQNLR